MKKFIFLVMLLLSGFANANKIYNHTAAFVELPRGQRRGEDFIRLGFLSTYSDSNDQTNHALISIPDTNYTRDFPLPTGVVNNVKTYSFIHKTGEVETIGFIIIKGALYMVPKLGDSTGELQEILKESNINVIDVFATNFGLVVVANKEGESGVQNTVLINMMFVNDRIRSVSSKRLIDEATKSVEYSHYFTMDYLVLVTQSNKLLSVIRCPALGWKVEQNMSPKDGDLQVKVISGTNYGDIRVLKYGRDGIWSIASFNALKNRSDFSTLPIGENQPKYFDFALYSQSFQSTYSSTGVGEVGWLWSRSGDYEHRNLRFPGDGYNLVSMSLIDNYLYSSDGLFGIKNNFESLDISRISSPVYFLLHSKTDNKFYIAYPKEILNEVPRELTLTYGLPE